MTTPDLVELAKAARTAAYCPYSGYAVGAAIEGEDGRVWTGVNVENVSYGATICAERSAVVKMVADGVQRIRRMALVTKDGGTPCGTCLQVLREFAPDPSTMEIILANPDGILAVRTLDQFLPFGFGSDEVPRTESSR